jgi:uncharacterized protein YciW
MTADRPPTSGEPPCTCHVRFPNCAVHPRPPASEERHYHEHHYHENHFHAEVRATPPALDVLVNALAYALARAQLPDRMESSRDYAERLAPLVIESGWLSASGESPEPSGEPTE